MQKIPTLELGLAQIGPAPTAIQVTDVAGAAIQAPALYRSVGITAERVGIVLPYVVVLLDLRRLMRLGMTPLLSMMS